MLEDKIIWILASIYTFLSIFGLTKYARLKAKVNHTFLIYYSIDFNRWFAIDIRERGIVIVPVEKALKECKSAAVMQCNFDLWIGVRKATKHFGEGYDWRGVLNAVLGITIFVLFGYKPKKINNSHKRFVCSEFVTTVINESDINKPLGNPMEIYPNLLYILTKDNKNFTTLIEKKNLNIEELKGLIKSLNGG